MGRLSIWPPNAQFLPLKQIYNSQRQRVVRTNDCEIYSLVKSKRQELGQIFRPKVHAFHGNSVSRKAFLSHPRIPGRTPQTSHVR